MKKVLVLGGTTFDSIIYLESLPKTEPQTIHYAPMNETMGSTGAGKALNLAKLNVETVLHSIIGEDLYGEKIIKALEASGVNFIYDIDPKGTERHVNLMDQKGNRISIFVTQSSSDLQLDMSKIEEIIRQCDIVVLNIIGYTKQLIHLIRKYKKPVWTDLHDYNLGNPYHEDYIKAADYIFVSSDNMPDYRNTMKKWMDSGKELVVCTHGKNGATALTKEGKWIEIPIIEDYKFKDANGAGDSFFSGFLYGNLKGKTIEECLRFGTICAGLCITSPELSFENLSEKLINSEYERYFK
ncbi:carbohydrate kinase family protein [Clostridium folliculivorans]|uniref:Fructoselysine kinase n=1 Tax=Clostridium folliculivorans TaxID=2886038 RepID=A0A9W5Y1U5_9CLOT|nr:carbohydrate kinase family protein [Clostridium folliculivorans]GKU25179.1 fructoselysine kinase [Clostridium folliculivorans]GKU31277.1 fructoselysine kinase [Clostridium folliculivorans]